MEAKTFTTRYNASGQPCRYRLKLYFYTGAEQDHTQTYYAHLKATHTEEYKYLEKLLLEFGTGKRKYKVGGKNATFKSGLIYNIIDNTEVKRINRADMDELKEAKAAKRAEQKLPYPVEPDMEAIKFLPQHIRQQAMAYWRSKGYKSSKTYTPGGGERIHWRKE